MDQNFRKWQNMCSMNFSGTAFINKISGPGWVKGAAIKVTFKISNEKLDFNTFLKMSLQNNEFDINGFAMIQLLLKKMKNLTKVKTHCFYLGSISQL